MKLFLVLAFVAAVSADVSHLRKYLPPVQDNNIGASSINVESLRKYLPPTGGSSQQEQGFQPQALFQQPSFQQQAPEQPSYQSQSSSQQTSYQQYQQQQPQGTQYPKPAASFDDTNGYSYNVPQ